MTSKAIYYYSLSGNTKSIIDESDVSGFDVYDLLDIDQRLIDFSKYSVLLFGASTYGKGVPHKIIRDIYPLLNHISDKCVGLFGSGNSHYEYYCGALDVIEEVLNAKNNILFKFKFEGYPTNQAKNDFQKLINYARGLK